MTRRNPPAKWTLPDVVDPSEHICFKIEVPLNVYHIGAFRGALWNLCSAVNWQDDPDHIAKDVANVWKRVYDNVSLCDSCDENNGILLEDFMSQQIRISPDDSCIIQMWCIDHWEDWYDPRECIANGIAQPTGGGDIAVGECKSYDVVLYANDRWLLPVPVQGDFTIEVTGASGGWNDGTLGWFCQDGFTYALGACVSAHASEAGDPLASANHMTLLAEVDGVFYDVIDNPINVPSSVTDAEVVFQCNDSILSDNQGSISFKVTVCNRSHTGQVSLTSVTSPSIVNRGVLSANVVSIGDFFTFQLAAQPSPPYLPYDGKFITSDQVTLRVAAVTNWTPGTGWQWFSPDTGSAGAPSVGDSQSTAGFAGNAVTQAIVQFEVMSIP